MYYDLNVPWTSDFVALERTLSFLAELDYDVVALNHVMSGGKLAAGAGEVACAIPDPLPFAVPRRLRVLRRCTLTVTDSVHKQVLAALAAAYDVVALRPTDEATLQHCCGRYDCDLVSLDLTQRFPVFFKHKTLGAAVARGVRIEINYAQGSFSPPRSAAMSAGIGTGYREGGDSLGSAGGPSAAQRQNLVNNAIAIIRATRGRGIVIASEAARALACRAPADVVNLAAIWGLSQERGREAVGTEARAVVVQAEMKRRSFNGVIDVIYGGEAPVKPAKVKKEDGGGGGAAGVKRKAGAMMEDKTPANGNEITLSKREKKRRAKKAREEQAVQAAVTT